MIDLETLDVSSSAIIVAIGAVAFNNKFDTVDEKMILVDLSRTYSGVTASVDTCLFWFKQLRKNPEMLKLFKGDVYEPDALDQLGLFIDELKETKNTFWSKGSFDFNILNHRYAAYDKKTPWRYNEIRDARTVINLPRDGMMPPVKLPTNENLHDPISDCKNQIEQMRAVLFQK